MPPSLRKLSQVSPPPAPTQKPGRARAPAVAVAEAGNEQRLLDHALHSFATRGYAATGLRTIAADAQVTAPMVNYYFQTKESLYQRVTAMVIDGVVAAMEAAYPENGTLLEALIANLRAHLAYTAAHPEAIRFLFGIMYGPDEGRPAIDFERYGEVEARIRQRIDRAVRTGELMLRPGVTRVDAFELYQGMVMNAVMHDLKAPEFCKPLTDIRAATRRLSIVLAGVGTLRT